ncbi:MAG: hypothetical protein AMS15_03080 [Planctomycetes bacterium DG_23]|nr:MAG: hypothetical protein AMS15_03080 [Planctomycetes bacterium DG_23]
MKRPIPAEIKVEPTREAESEETAELRVLLEQLQAELEKERKAKDKLEEELARLKAENQRLKALVSEKASPEDGHLRFPVEKISLGFLTGGADWDEKEGDDGLIVFLHPQDREDDTIKRAGKVRFELFDLTQEEVVVMGWDFTAEEAIKNWRNFPTGYQFKLPWKGSPPTASELILKATFTDLDGKDFIATKRIRVRLASE